MSSSKVGIELEAYAFIDIEMIEGELTVLVELTDKECEESYFIKTISLSEMVNKLMEYAEYHELEEVAHTLSEISTGITNYLQNTTIVKDTTNG